eukprot:TRINITY_DN23336_c0_g1_i1.p1 TRINITY_DN23336_c0_g1~~TRINITY_DN23336_c0_g1_i1.p1  ORF type:complete len:183 (+),score=67.83 TRINITY_DN23336_c0_g1_i1:220-768(+)
MEDLEACAKLRIAVRQGNIIRVEEALKLAGVNPNIKTSRDITSHTPLTQAVELDRPDIIRLLLKHPACDPNIKGIDGFTPLTLAITKASSTIVSMLLAFPPVDVNLREGGGLTALHLAVLYNNKELVTMLVKDKRVDREATSEGQTPLDMAKIMDNPNEDIIAAISQPVGSSAFIQLVTRDK